MDYYVIETNWDEDNNSPWDAIWPDLPDDALDCLLGSLPLAAIWTSPPVTLEKRQRRPGVFGFVLHYAVTEAVRDLIAPIVQDEAEFLPLSLPNRETAYVIHPLWPVDFDERAEVEANQVSGNISVVCKYSFTLDPEEFGGPRHLFRMRHPNGSAARNRGSTLHRLIASQPIKDACEKAGISGVVFKNACSA